MRISSIVAVTDNNVIGKDNDLPWHMPHDLKYFMRTTKGHHIIMGRKNFESLPQPLKNRTNIVLSRDPFFIATGIFVFPNLNEALDFCQERGEEEVFIIGGAEIYSLAMPLIDRLYYTRIHAAIEGDTFFPSWDQDSFELISEEHHHADDRHPYDYTFYVYERKYS